MHLLHCSNFQTGWKSTIRVFFFFFFLGIKPFLWNLFSSSSTCKIMARCDAAGQSCNCFLAGRISISGLSLCNRRRRSLLWRRNKLTLHDELGNPDHLCSYINIGLGLFKVLTIGPTFLVYSAQVFIFSIGLGPSSLKKI